MRSLRPKPKRDTTVGYTSGVYDLFHIGHLNLLKNAKAMCDILIVGVSTDELVQVTKGRTPVIPFTERLEIVRAISVVDVVIPQENTSKIEAWERLHFDRLFVGDDWFRSPSWSDYGETLKSAGVKIIFFPYTKGTSSTKINRILESQL